MIGTRIHITGIVQGVGFRPFVYTQALQKNLKGWVRNTSSGVDILVSGDAQEIEQFISALRTDVPPLAHIDSVEILQEEGHEFTHFEIIESQPVPGAFQPISPDICICPDCLEELFNPQDRRYRYPFINCTNCGPRLTIIEGIPYDRPNTTMRDFEMCPACQAEYTDPADRRFHAQPIACPDCGPQVWLETSPNSRKSQEKGLAQGDEAIHAVQNLLLKGKIVAIKGLGGFHLACDATNSKAVAELRRRKLRVDKAFAVMTADIHSVEQHCRLSGADRELLESRERPIVIVDRQPGSSIAREVAPSQDTLGVMLPYTPLHYLLFAAPEPRHGLLNKNKQPVMPPLVMTSGNLSEEPIAIENDEALERLGSLADAFLLHNRPIRTRCDDSVVRTYHGDAYFLRRSRGYTPFPVYLPEASPQVLATGGELKNTFCLVRDRYAFLSHHIGDMQNVETYQSFQDGVTHYENLFRIHPEAIAYDPHPDYLASRYALERATREGLPSYGVQHHHAHIASCMAENDLPAGHPVIGVAFDGTGYGEDGAIWGSEFMLADYTGYTRLSHLKYVPLPGGDLATRKPARVALAYLWDSNLEWEPSFLPVAALCAEELHVLKSQLRLKLNTPLTSSMGRLFDAVAALCGIRQEVNYEAQAAIELEALADPDETGEYPFSLEPDRAHLGCSQINCSPMIEQIVTDLSNRVPIPAISARFHNTLGQVVLAVCDQGRIDHSVGEVVLSGGVWQNLTLLRHTERLLLAHGFKVYIHHKVPTNDGGMALGQALVAIYKMKAAS